MNGSRSQDSIRATVYRTASGAPRVFEVKRTEPMMVLDVLLAIQRDHDASLAFRFSCRVAMCGTCTVRVDGQSVLACQTRVLPEVGALRIDPVAGLPVIRDLIVDTSPFWRQWASVIPFTPDDDRTEPAIIPPESPERQLIGPALDCIGCGACYSACGIAAAGRDFLGPAALQRAMTLIADSRDVATDDRMGIVAGSGSLDRCHYMYECTAACPKGLDPAKAIRKLRRWRNHGGA